MSTAAVPGLFVYGTLAPGKPNHPVVSDIDGSWEQASLRGQLHDEGWGAASGCPGIVPDPAGDPVAGWVLLSAELTAHWTRLDAFEGEGYTRVPVTVETPDGRTLGAEVYALNRG
ncbi:MAG: gamma-glutamylcyclotransferase family protein [Pseudomonadota bacterium]